MRLADLIEAIKQPKLVITVRDGNSVELIKFYTGGQSYLSSDLLSKQVSEIRIENAQTVSVLLKDVIES